MLNKPLLITLLASAISSTAFAASPEATDRDLDDDGLIEINNWADLNELRNSLYSSFNGAKLYGSDLGCPATGCTGYELTADLDFDTNGDGKLDANDTYWNNGNGWQPLPLSHTLFEGNGHLIRNLMVKDAAFGGLFGDVTYLNIRNLGLTGKLMSIEGIAYAGGLAGNMTMGSVKGCFSTGAVTTSGNYAGGLVGMSLKTRFEAVFSSAQVNGAVAGGGLIGYGIAEFDSSYAVSKPTTNKFYGGLSGSTNYYVNSYWAKDIMGEGNTIGDTGMWGTAATLKEMQVATSDFDVSSLYVCPADAICSKPAPINLYVGWSQVRDERNQPYWDFGTEEQLPGLVLHGVLYRDSDGNGVLDMDENKNASSSASTAASSVATSASSQSSSPASSASANSSAAATAAQSSNAAAQSSSAAPQSSAPTAAKDSGGGSMDLLMLVLLSCLGLAWRGKKAA